MKDSISILQEVASKYGATVKVHPPGTRLETTDAELQSRERAPKNTNGMGSDAEVDMELIIRGGHPEGKLD